MKLLLSVIASLSLVGCSVFGQSNVESAPYTLLKADPAMMSFVMPKEFTLQTTPKPTNPDVKVTELKNYKVAAIEFSGTLSNRNVARHSKMLTDWINVNGYTAIGEPVEAGYNGPLTLPMLRRNEVLIEIK